uniref:Secreted protein n=1 Tax=Oryza meridionalis TaxID=40149 RepID=A0A0E0F6Y8_9ORYZ
MSIFLPYSLCRALLCFTSLNFGHGTTVGLGRHGHDSSRAGPGLGQAIGPRAIWPSILSTINRMVGMQAQGGTWKNGGGGSPVTGTKQ